jgi:predicted N-acetyltransferase YhbS
MQVRFAREEEAPLLSRLAQRSKAHWGYPTEWLRAWEAELAITDVAVRSGVCLVAESGGEVVGFTLANHARHRWRLAHLWVDPTALGAGVGRALLAAVAREARMAGVPALEIVSDPNAEGFYRRMGARRTGVSPAPMPDAPERVLPVLVLELSPGRSSGATSTRGG